MKVAILGGYAPSLINFRGPLIRAMLASGHEVVAMAPARDGRGEVARAVAEELRAWGVRFRAVPLRRAGMNPLRDAVALSALVRAFRAERPDALLAYTIKPVIYGSLAARAVGVEGIYSIVTGLGYAFGDGSLRQRALGGVVRQLYRWGLRVNRRVFFQNPDDLALFRNEGLVRAGQALLVNGSGVDLAHYALAPLPSGPVRFLLIARLLADKGILEYVEAARVLKGRYPQLAFDLVGPLDPNPMAISLAQVRAWEREGVVRYLGEAKDVRPHLARCTVYVLPSYREGTPRTVLEAMAMGRPVVTTDAPGCRETVLDGVNGFLVPVGDARALARALERFVLEPGLVARMGAESRRIAEEKFDVHKVNAVILGAMGLAQNAPSFSRACSGPV
jgi:glycosyltransferase involved in cell wall biosynthesis